MSEQDNRTVDELQDHIADLEAERDRAEAENVKLRRAITLMGPPVCEHLHHRPQDYHEAGPCPVEDRINTLTRAAAEAAKEEG